MTDLRKPPCLCGRPAAFKDCCGLYLDGGMLPSTAEDLMRSRYSAFALQRIDYLKETLWPKYQPGFDAFATAKWASDTHWAGLEVIAIERGGPNDRQGTVLFEARYLSAGQLRSHREKSLFKKSKGRWYYLEAITE